MTAEIPACDNLILLLISVDPSLRRTPDSGQLLPASNNTSTNEERQQQKSNNNSSVVPGVVPYDPAHGLSPYEVLTSEQISKWYKNGIKYSRVG